MMGVHLSSFVKERLAALEEQRAFEARQGVFCVLFREYVRTFIIMQTCFCSSLYILCEALNLITL